MKRTRADLNDTESNLRFVNEREETNISTIDSRELIALLAIGWRSLYLNLASFWELLKYVKLEVTVRTLYNWIRNIKGNTMLNDENEIKGRGPVLNEVEIMVLTGWILGENDQKRVVSYNSVMKTCKEFFGVSIHYDTTRNYVGNMRISHKKLVSKGPDLKNSHNEIFESLKKCAEEFKYSGFFDGEAKHENIICLVFIHDSHWDEAHCGLGAKSSPTKGKRVRNPKTSAFLVGNSLSGRVLPPIMFTLHDKFLRVGGILSSFTDTDFGKLLSHNLKEWQFVHISDIDTVDNKQNVSGESKYMVRKALELWRANDPDYGTIGTKVFITDRGSAFRIENSSFLEFWGCIAHLSFIPSSHMLMSTCDHGTNLTTKVNWRAKAMNLEGSHACMPGDAINMMYEATNFTKEYIVKCWTRNLLMDVKDIDYFTLDDFKKRFKYISDKWGPLHKECTRQYEDFKGKRGEFAYLRKEGTARAKDTGLNGKYWDDWEALKKGNF